MELALGWASGLATALDWGLVSPCWVVPALGLAWLWVLA